jgi:hypothetical protein
VLDYQKLQPSPLWGGGVCSAEVLWRFRPLALTVIFAKVLDLFPMDVEDARAG